ncbi:UDP-N-acetylmuramate dehydrogenase [Azomonas agilis]|uniref:UDP-N-acetylmuramate dehydrogenase n=1 Tax=Azomonas agilis TaxID=116849 RepID=UPI0011A3539E|nr:UDP-N-acetylmuramate dehydrogenase [Azomonas agilis]
MTLVVREQVDLRPYNSFALAVRARWFAELTTDEQAIEALNISQTLDRPIRVLGGGSNVLLTSDLEALVLHVRTQGIRILSDDGAQVILEAEAGELWQDVVQYSLQQGLSGLENLSLIPGTAGAAPVQNIGAYGVELRDVCAGLTALDCYSGQLKDFTPEDCAFAYRDSRFKREAGRWLVLRVRFCLSRYAPLHLEYGLIRQRLHEQGCTEPTAAAVSAVVCAIRQEKLPDPKILGNAGSFFKNPVISEQQAQSLRAAYPNLVAYPQAHGQVKLAAAWLIDQAGWKGFREGDAGVHRLQALVLVNYGQATGAQILDLARRIQEDVVERFGVLLEMEPVLF